MLTSATINFIIVQKMNFARIRVSILNCIFSLQKLYLLSKLTFKLVHGNASAKVASLNLMEYVKILTSVQQVDIFVKLVCYPCLVCSKGYRCLNTMGSYTCSDVDECLDDLHDCNISNSACNNTYGSYTCTCLSGYKGKFQNFDVLGSQTNLTCEDIDECIDDLYVCDITKSECNNTDGSYTCTCLPGYKGSFHHFDNFVPLTLKPKQEKDNLTCEDVDECQAQGKCPKNSACENTDGSFTCRCSKVL